MQYHASSARHILNLLFTVPPIAAKPLILELSVSSTHLLTAAQQSDCSQYDHSNSAKLKT